MATEKRLIDANALQRLLLPITMGLEKEYGSLGGAVSGVMMHIDNAPTVDAVEVVRCEDCKYRVLDTVNGEDWCNHTLGLCGEVYATDFCCHGERKDND